MIYILHIYYIDIALFRSSSVIISRAKIKSVKLTLVIIALYIVCSAPFVLGQILSSHKIM